jgi:rod shape-determining protein MreC
MKNLLNFLAKYINLILFILLEGLALYLIVNSNEYHNIRLIKSLKGITSSAEGKISNVVNYFKLRDINKDLALENAALRNSISRFVKRDNLLFFSFSDTILNQQYEYTSARIVNNSVNKQKNFFTLDKGRKQGIDADMGVITPEGIAGFVVGSSENYSVAMSVLNIDFRLSSRIKSNGYFGSLTWDGRDYRHAVLNDIPQHVTVNIGDTIETTGYSAIFPEGIILGVISSYDKSGSDFYRIRVALAVNFKKLNYVNIIRNLKKEEQQTLENLFQ